MKWRGRAAQAVGHCCVKSINPRSGLGDFDKTVPQKISETQQKSPKSSGILPGPQLPSPKSNAKAAPGKPRDNRNLHHQGAQCGTCAAVGWTVATHAAPSQELRHTPDQYDFQRR